MYIKVPRWPLIAAFFPSLTLFAYNIMNILNVGKFRGSACLLIALSAAVLPAHAQVNVLTQHNDNARSGANLNETILNTSNVNVNSFGKLFSYTVSGDVLAQPLYVSGLNIAGGTHNVLYVVTMNDVVYAFDADSNTQLWSVSLPVSPETPVPIAGIVGSNTLNIHNNVGIEGTPVIDLSTNTIYLVARTINGTTYFQRLHALDILTGAEKFGGPVTITASVSGTGNGSSGGTLAFDPKMENQRPGLALANGNVVITWAGHEDKEPWHGWVIAYNASTLAQVSHFCPSPNSHGCGFWNAGQAPAVDASGNVYMMTGNGSYDGVTEFSNSFLKFTSGSGGLTMVDWFTPDNAGSGTNTGDNPTNEDAHDLDLASAGAMLVPGTSQVFGGGKLGMLYLVNTASMGHEVLGDTQIVQNFQGVAVNSTCGYNHLHGAPVYWNSATNGPTVYMWGENDSGRAYKYVGGQFQTTASSHTAATSPTTGCGMPGGILAISANGNAAGTGILWASTVNTGNAVHNNVPSILRALNADNLAVELWNSNMNSTRDNSGTLAKYVPPTIANGKVYMPTWNQDAGGTTNTINVYGLLSGGGSSLNFEAENLTYTPNGATASVQTDVNSSNGEWIVLSATAAGQYIDYAIPSVAAGTYQVQMEWKGNGSRGTLQLSVDGTNLGSTLDQYSAAQTYPTTTFGNVTFGSTGTHTIRLTATGKNASSTGFGLSADRFILVPQSGGGQVATPTFSPVGGTYTSSQTVTITSSTSGASIRYTTDGSTPSETVGTIYSSPVSITVTTTLKAIAYKSGMTDSAVASATYTINTGGGGTTVSFEAESITNTPTGATSSVQTDVNSSGGKWILLSATATGQSISYAIPSVTAGTYQVQMEWKGNNTRGTLQLSVDGANLGSTLDQYSAAQSYPTTTFGTVTFGSAGTHTVKLTVTGKNASSTGFGLSADKFTFLAQ